MLKTWGKAIEKINIRFSSNNANVMETTLQFPRLKEFQLGSFSKSFPYDKLQERDIAYSIHVGLGNGVSLKSLRKNKSRFKLSDYMNVKETSSRNTSEKISLERSKILKRSQQKHFLFPGYNTIPGDLRDPAHFCLFCDRTNLLFHRT